MFEPASLWLFKKRIYQHLSVAVLELRFKNRSALREKVCLGQNRSYRNILRFQSIRLFGPHEPSLTDTGLGTLDISKRVVLVTGPACYFRLTVIKILLSGGKMRRGGNRPCQRRRFVLFSKRWCRLGCLNAVGWQLPSITKTAVLKRTETLINESVGRASRLPSITNSLPFKGFT